MPATPMATSVMPWRQARPNESEITTATSTPGSSASASRSLAAEASGSTGSRQTVSSPGTFEASTPALAQTKPWWVSEMTMPRSMRTMRRLSLKHDLDLARVLPVACRVTLRERGRLDRAKVDQTALGLADDLVRHDEHVAGRRSPATASRDHTVQVVAGTDLGEALDAKHLDPLHGRATPVSLRRARSPAVSRSKARWGRSQILTSRPRRAGSPKVRLEAVYPEGEGQDVGGSDQERVRAGTRPVRGDDRRRPLARLLQHRAHVTRIEERKVCGEDEERARHRAPAPCGVPLRGRG